MPLLHRRTRRPGCLVFGLAVCGVIALGATPVAAAGRGRSAVAPRRAAAPRPVVTLLPVEGAACLFPIPGQECSEEERHLCDAPATPDPVVVDCDDPANAWVLEMVGECDMPHLAAHVVAERERERSRDTACVDPESCSAPRPSATAASFATDYQPAIDRLPAVDHQAAQRRAVAPDVPRRHPGYARGIDRPPRP